MVAPTAIVRTLCAKLGFGGEFAQTLNLASHSERQRNFVEGALASRYKIEEQSDEGIYKGVFCDFSFSKLLFCLYIKYFFALEGILKLHYRSLCKQRF